MSETGVVQTTELGSFPNDWLVQRLDSLFAVQQGKQVSKANRIGQNQRPFLRTKNVFWGRLDLSDLDEMHFTDAEEKRLALQPGDLLVCEGGDIGRTAIWKGEAARCYYQNHLHRLRARDKAPANSEFVLYWLWYAFEVGSVYFGRGNVTTIPNLSQSKVRELPLPVPPLPEQVRIAEILRLVQLAVEQQTHLLRVTTELKQALLHQLFTDGLRGERQKQTEIGPVPESWDVVRIQDLVDRGTIAKPMDGNHGNIHPKSADFVERGIPFVMASDLIHGTIDLTGCAYLRKEHADRLQKGFANGGDVLISHKATIGVTAIVPEVEHYVMLTPQVTYYRVLEPKRLNNIYLKAFFDSDLFQKKFHTVARDGSTRSYIGITKQRELYIALPSIAEQLEIANCFALVERKSTLASRTAAALAGLFRNLLHQLMTAELRIQDVDLRKQATWP